MFFYATKGRNSMLTSLDGILKLKFGVSYHIHFSPFSNLKVLDKNGRNVTNTLNFIYGCMILHSTDKVHRKCR